MPWTTDSVLSQFKFTNAYRASDRVSQYLIKNVIYDAPHSARDLVVRVLLFKIFNRIDTWEGLGTKAGNMTFNTFDPDRLNAYLDDRKSLGKAIYSPAYIIPPTSKTGPKHHGHVDLLRRMMSDRLDERIQEADSLEEVFCLLRSYKSVGPFLAFQWAIDLNYSRLIDFSEMDFVVAGPGALRGIKRSFSDLRDYSPADAIRWVAERQDEEFAKRRIEFLPLWNRPLQLVDCQNLFCELDKYSRVAFPQSHGVDGKRIKQRFQNPSELPHPWYPPKWKLNAKVKTIPIGVEAQFVLENTN